MKRMKKEKLLELLIKEKKNIGKKLLKEMFLNQKLF